MYIYNIHRDLICQKESVYDKSILLVFRLSYLNITIHEITHIY